MDGAMVKHAMVDLLGGVTATLRFPRRGSSDRARRAADRWCVGLLGRRGVGRGS